MSNASTSTDLLGALVGVTFGKGTEYERERLATVRAINALNVDEPGRVDIRVVLLVEWEDHTLAMVEALGAVRVIPEPDPLRTYGRTAW